MNDSYRLQNSLHLLRTGLIAQILAIFLAIWVSYGVVDDILYSYFLHTTYQSDSVISTDNEEFGEHTAASHFHTPALFESPAVLVAIPVFFTTIFAVLATIASPPPNTLSVKSRASPLGYTF